ncbi:MAG TPA: N-acetyltransferase [Candidatus Aenigmarchaeota archaeon]|nr:N-acetyltransferase [Candidatus Aenigmarchaeota archaeon]
MNLIVEHDETAQKFTADANGEECLLAYTIVNNTLNLHVMVVPDGKAGEEAAEQLCMTVFEYAKKNNFKIISSSEQIDDFIKKHPEFDDLVDKE